jgi:CheY-like chemotaxis protein
MFRVLVVDDDISFARTIGGDLQHQGFAVEISTSADDALHKMQREMFDVLLTDLRLGDSSGMSLLAAVRDASPHTRAVLMSGYATARDYERAVELGAVRVLTKPFTPADLMQCIRQAVDCGSGFHGSVHGLSLVDLLQMYKFGRRSVKIAVAGRSLGTLYMREGELVHAEHDGHTGEDAVASILAMPEGTVGTSVMPPAVPHTIERDFQTVLLSALHAIDETLVDSQAETKPIDDDSFERAFQPEEITAIAPRQLVEDCEQALPPQTRMLQRTREINGYLAACMFLAESGGVVCFDGIIDLRPAANITAEALRRKQQTLVDMGMDDQAEDMIVTSTNHYHLLRRLHFDIPAFIYLVLDRSLTNPTLAMIELEHAVREQTFSKQPGE